MSDFSLETINRLDVLNSVKISEMGIIIPLTIAGLVGAKSLGNLSLLVT